MIAISLLAISLTTLFGSQSQSVSLGATIMFNVQAPLLAQLKETEILSDSQHPVSSSSGDFGEDYPGYQWQVETEDISMESTVLNKIAEKLQRLTLTISRGKDSFVLQSIVRKELPR